MKDRIPGAPGKYSAVVSGQELQKLQTGKPFAITLTRDDQPIEKGTPYSKAAVLPDDMAERLCAGMEDPAPADAFRGIAAELGDPKKELALGLASHWNEAYFDAFGSAVEASQQHHAYTFAIPDALRGRTIKVKTYMYGEMSCSLYETVSFGEVIEGTVVTNPAANVAEDPASGIIELEFVPPITVNGRDYTGQVCQVSFYENPYIAAPEVYQACGTVWEEIKRLRNTAATDGVVEEYAGDVTVISGG